MVLITIDRRRAAGRGLPTGPAAGLTGAGVPVAGKQVAAMTATDADRPLGSSPVRSET